MYIIRDVTNITTSAVEMLPTSPHLLWRCYQHHHICCGDVTNIITSAVEMLPTSSHLLYRCYQHHHICCGDFTNITTSQLALVLGRELSGTFLLTLVIATHLLNP
jgi:hypothetical protein